MWPVASGQFAIKTFKTPATCASRQCWLHNFVYAFMFSAKAMFDTWMHVHTPTHYVLCN